MAQVKDLLQSMIAINERKFSILIALLIIMVLYILVSDFKDQRIASDLIEVIKWLIGGVVGINLVQGLGEIGSIKRQMKDIDNIDKGSDF